MILTQPNLKFVTALSRQNCAVRLGLSVAVPKLERALLLLNLTHSAQRTGKTQRKPNKKYVKTLYNTVCYCTFSWNQTRINIGSKRGEQLMNTSIYIRLKKLVTMLLRRSHIDDISLEPNTSKCLTIDAMQAYKLS